MNIFLKVLTFFRIIGVFGNFGAGIVFAFIYLSISVFYSDFGKIKFFIICLA